MGRPVIQYNRHPGKQLMDLMNEVVERRTSTFPFLIIVDLYLDVHDEVKLDLSQVKDGIIKLTFDQKDWSQDEYNSILTWLTSKL